MVPDPTIAVLHMPIPQSEMVSHDFNEIPHVYSISTLPIYIDG